MDWAWTSTPGASAKELSGLGASVPIEVEAKACGCVDGALSENPGSRRVASHVEMVVVVSEWTEPETSKRAVGVMSYPSGVWCICVHQGCERSQVSHCYT
jgi:hypothetical protein